MPALDQAFILSLAATLFLIFIFVYLFLEERSRHNRLWALSFLLWLGAYVFEPYGVKSGSPPVLIAGGYFLPLLSNFLLLTGTYQFTGRKSPRWPAYCLLLSACWFSAGIYYHLPFFVRMIPLFVPLGATFVWTGVVILGSWKTEGLNRLITGLAYILGGLHAADYPVLRNVHTFAPWGFTIDAVLKIIIAICLLIEFSYKTKLKLAENEKRFRLLAENAQDIVYRFRVHPERKFDYISPAATTIAGYTPEEFYADPLLCQEITHPEDLPFLNEAIQNSNQAPHTFTLRWIRKDNRVIWVEGNSKPICDKNGNLEAFEGILRDVSVRKHVEEELSLQKAYFKQLFENSPEGVVIIDLEGKVLDINKGFETLFQYSIAELKGRSLEETIVPPELIEEGFGLLKTTLAGGSIHKETIRSRKDGSRIDVAVLGYTITLNHNPIGVYVIYRDITERKQAENHLQYISYHDSLTGLFNRLYFERQMQELQGGHTNPVSIVLCDLNGLKFVNDTLGHDTGDRVLLCATEILEAVFCREEGLDQADPVIARVGGDEFAVILRHNGKFTEGKLHELHIAINAYNKLHPELPLSLSAGYASTDLPLINIYDIYKEADNNMYREKLLCRQSAHNAIVQTLMKALEARDFITEGHADRLQDLVAELAGVLQFPEHSLSTLRLLAQFHDIGKVGIPDRILFKPGSLTPREMAIMHSHCEIGHRIALAAPNLTPIAEGILKHHEWWNGNGYPLGLKGDEIPIECRILAIADAYDAMTSDRPYRKALAPSEALLELKRCSGSQFDPALIEKFIQCDFLIEAAAGNA